METAPQPASGLNADHLAEIELRLARIEQHLGIAPTPARPAPAPLAAAPAAPAPAAATPAAALLGTRGEDELEFEVGRNWFAFAGILALTLGGGFLIVLPHPSLPSFLPSVLGLAGAALLYAVTYRGRKALDLVARPLQGAAMVLFFLAILRLYFPAPRQVLDVQSLTGQALLAAVVVLNGILAWQRRSLWLALLALGTGSASALFAGTASLVLSLVPAMAVFAVGMSERLERAGVALAAMPLVFATYLVWAMGNPLRGGAYLYVAEPRFAPLTVLLAAVVFAAGMLRRGPAPREDGISNSSAILNCTLGYGCYLLHTAAAHRESFALAHTLASVVLLGIAVGFWLRLRSRVATFFYAMTGYAALTFAIVKASAVPGVFVWLSLQSVVVVATAVWFRSRFIVAANFSIYVGIVLAYIALAKSETGISLGFGVVALVTARLLNWQQHRLELKTELMRIAYLVSAFLVFPYSLSHLVPSKYVGLAWVALALGYYVLNGIFKNRKYRWMGHATLLLTTCYLVVKATSSFDPAYRVLSFLVLGTVLLIVSMVFSQLRKRQRPNPAASPPEIHHT